MEVLIWNYDRDIKKRMTGSQNRYNKPKNNRRMTLSLVHYTKIAYFGLHYNAASR